MKKLFILILSALAYTASYGVVKADYSSDKTVGCPPLVVNFTDNSSVTPTTWLWDFGNGNTSTMRNPSATFLASGTYHVKLYITSGNQTDSTVKNITVFTLPIVNFTVDKTNACLTDTINFLKNVTPGSAPVINYAWGFGNGLASSDSNARYKYPLPGTYGVTLVVQDTNGCSANKTIPQYITVHPSPTAAFTASPVSSCNASQLVTFTNQSTGNGISFVWSLDDSVTSTLANPTHLYQQEKKLVLLFVTDSNGCVARTGQQITAVSLVADFVASKTLACTGENILFANTSNFAGTSWDWDFGDGTVAHTLGPNKQYTTPGKYTVSLTIRDGACSDSITKPFYITIKNGLTSSLATFAADSTISCGTPLPVNFTNTTQGGVTFHWDFGNGDTSNLENPYELFNTQGNFTVTLTITDSNGCAVSGKAGGLIQTAKPVANFTADTVTCAGSFVQFTNLSTNAGTYFWTFGDGDTSNAKNPKNQYKNYGSYTVSLTAINPTGCDTTITKVNYIHVTKPHVGFEVSSTFSPCPPFVCLLTNQSDNSIVKYLWDFGDGYTDTAANPTHIFFYPGIYSVKLIGYTRQGCSDTLLRQNLIEVQGPTGNFTVAPASGCSPLNVSFSATTSGNTKTTVCDLADGTVIPDSLSFSHIYTAEKIYHPQFILTDHVGCTVSYHLDSITVKNPPQLHVSDTAVCAGTPVKISLASNADHYKWTPATYIQCDTCQTVIVNAPDTTTYQITATNNFGCQTKTTLHINVDAIPVLNNSVKANLCKNDAITLFVGNAARMAWSPAQYLSDSTSLSPICKPASSVTYTVTAYNHLGCSATTTVPVVLHDKVDVSVSDDSRVCPGSSVQLSTKLNYGSDVGVVYTWSPAGYLDNAGDANPIATLGDKTVNFRLIATSGNCVADTQNVTIHVNQLPTIEVSASVSTTANAEVPLYAASRQDLTYQWFSKDSLSCAECRRTNLYPTSSQIVYVEGKDAQGCSVRDSVIIEVQGCDAAAIFMPNTFTPNGDGLNDKFFIRSAALSTLKYFRIYDQWGGVAFETNNLNEGWDGRINGKEAPTGVYVYLLEGKCQNGYDVMKSGNITAIR